MSRLRERQEWRFFGVLYRADPGLAVAWWAVRLPGEGRVEVEVVEGELLATLPRDASATPWHAGPGVRVRGTAVVVRVQQRA